MVRRWSSVAEGKGRAERSINELVVQKECHQVREVKMVSFRGVKVAVR